MTPDWLLPRPASVHPAEGDPGVVMVGPDSDYMTGQSVLIDGGMLFV